MIRLGGEPFRKKKKVGVPGNGNLMNAFYVTEEVHIIRINSNNNLC